MSFSKNQLVIHNDTGVVGQVLSVNDFIVTVRWPSCSAEHLCDELSAYRGF